MELSEGHLIEHFLVVSLWFKKNDCKTEYLLIRIRNCYAEIQIFEDYMLYQAEIFKIKLQ